LRGVLLLIWWGQRTEDPERRHDHALLSPAHPGVGAVWHIVKMCVISAVSRAVAALPDDVLRSLPMYRAYLRVEGTLHSGYMFSSVALTFMGALNAALPFAWLAPIHAVGVATQAWHMSVVSSRWMQTKAAALGAQGWGAPRMRAAYGAASAVLGGPASAALPDCSIAHACAFQVFLSLLIGCVLSLAFVYTSERRAKSALLAANGGGGGGAHGSAGSGLPTRPLRGWWAPLAAWAVLAALWRVAGLYTRAQGDTVACPPGFA
jgi:hypothetical protein